MFQRLLSVLLALLLFSDMLPAQRHVPTITDALREARGGLGLEGSPDNGFFKDKLGSFFHPAENHDDDDDDDDSHKDKNGNDDDDDNNDVAHAPSVATSPTERQPILRSSPSAKQLSWIPEQCAKGPQCRQCPGSSSILGSRFCCQPGCRGCLVKHSALTFRTIKITCQCSSSGSSTRSISRNSSNASVSPTKQGGSHGVDNGHSNTNATVPETDDATVDVPAAARSLLKYVMLAVVVCACVILGAVGAVYFYFMRRSASGKHLKKKAEQESVEALRHAVRQSELRSLLPQVHSEEETHVTASAPTAPAAGVDSDVHPSVQQCAEADREVERVLAASTAREVLGTGSPTQRAARFRQLVRLLHPDKGLVNGERANLAYRRVVEAKHELDDTA